MPLLHSQLVRHPQQSGTMRQLVDRSAQVPGRIWEGKESVLTAVAAVTKACGSALSAEDGGRVVAALVEAADRKKSEFRQVQFEPASLDSPHTESAHGGRSTMIATAVSSAPI